MSVSPLPRTPVVAPLPSPRFVTGSIARHILVMTGTGAVGLMAIFVSDFATLFFLGLLGDLTLLAAVGYAGAIMFFMFSAGLGMAIAVASLVSPALGGGKVKQKGLSKKGDRYLRSLLVNGAMAVVQQAQKRPDKHPWVAKLLGRMPSLLLENHRDRAFDRALDADVGRDGEACLAVEA
jgi:MatE/Transposase IS116/IS110/IS902 family